MGKYIIFNDKLILSENNIFNTENRAFRYGDAFFETMRCNTENIHFFDLHYNRIQLALNTLKMERHLSLSKEMLFGNIIRLLKKNRFYKTTRIRLTIFRKSGGLYTPNTLSVSYIIEVEELQNTSYRINKKGLLFDFFTDIQKPVNILSKFKTTNSLIFILAGIYKTEINVDDCVLLNQNGFICETISSNIFYIKKKQLITPSLNSGCVDGIMRNKIISLAKNIDLEVSERDDITKEELIDADEIFTSNSISGINWLVGYKQKRYYKKYSSMFIAEIEKFTNNS